MDDTHAHNSFHSSTVLQSTVTTGCSRSLFTTEAPVTVSGLTPVAPSHVCVGDRSPSFTQQQRRVTTVTVRAS